VAGLLGVSQAAFAQSKEIPLYPGVAPGSESWTQKEVEYLNPQKQKMARNVVTPTLTPFLPERAKASGTAVIVCPGGGFHFLSWQHEGTEVAQWLADHGVAAFVLKYRLVDTGATEEEFQKRLAAFFSRLSGLPEGGKPFANQPNVLNVISLAAADGRQAVKVVRQRAAEWGIATDRIGLLGFSAGGMVTSEAALHHDADNRPNFAAPIYGAPFDAVTVPADAPPLFILCASDDTLAATACVRLYSTWKAANKPAELHMYSKGGHGFGMNKRGMPIDNWIERFGDWLGGQGLLKPLQKQ
jgi:acetyl esterase/lipase